MYDCKILADSISERGHRLTTFQITYPYIIHAEIMTHRMFSRNTQSSRATPVMTNVMRVAEDPFIPSVFRKNVKGMTDGHAFDDHDAQRAADVWKQAISDAIHHAKVMAELEVHKALANRVLGPYQWWTMLLTATDFDNFFALRCHPEAQAEIRTIAEIMLEHYRYHEPQQLKEGQWHMPLIQPDEVSKIAGIPVVNDWWTKVAIGRCARVSYLTHDGKRDSAADVDLYKRLLNNGHMSPFEHVARPFSQNEWDCIGDLKYALVMNAHQANAPSAKFRAQLSRQLDYAGNHRGWWSARMDVPNQHNFGLS